MRLFLEDLKTHMVRAGLVMFGNSLRDGFDVARDDKSIYEAIAALCRKVFIREPEAAPVVAVAFQIEISRDVPPPDAPGPLQVRL